MEWKKPQITSFEEKALIERLEAKAQYHGDGFLDQHLDVPIPQ